MKQIDEEILSFVNNFIRLIFQNRLKKEPLEIR